MEGADPAASRASRRPRSGSSRSSGTSRSFRPSTDSFQSRSERASRTPQRSSKSSSFGRSSSSANAWGKPAAPVSLADRLSDLADLSLLITLAAVTAWFGGRTPIGYMIFASLTLLTATLYSVSHALSGKRRWIWTGTELLWILGAAIPVVQMLELSPSSLQAVSPHLQTLLPLWGDALPANPLQKEWTTLSLNPSEGIGGLQLFAVYAILFVTLTQRLQNRHDVAWLMRGIALITIGWATFGLAQYTFSNGLYYWVFEHPFTITSTYVTGPISNRNHFAHLLALGIGPLIYCAISAAMGSTEQDGTMRPPAQGQALAWGLGLMVVIVAILLTLSRGGMLAIAVAMVVAAVPLVSLLSTRAGWIPLAMVAVVAGIGIFGYSAIDRILLRAATTDNEARLIIWDANLKVFSDFPWFGTGIGTHADAHLTRIANVSYENVYTHAESSFLQVASETGLAGLLVAGGMLLMAVGWPLRVLFSKADLSLRLATVGVLSSLLAHVAHALADFVWYVPACMATVAALAAAGHGLLREHLDTKWGLVPAPSPGLWRMAPLIPLAVAFWLAPDLSTAWQRDREQTTYLWQLYRANPALAGEDEEAQREWEITRAKTALSVARSNPQSTSAHMLLAGAYLRLFDLKQMQQETPMTLTELKDVVASSGFENEKQVRQWLGKVTGRNARLLDRAWHHALRAVQLSPLQAPAYLILAKLSFLHDHSGQLNEALLQQALVIRPNDPNTWFQIGQQDLLSRRTEQGIEHFARAFERSEKLRPQIVPILCLYQDAMGLSELLQLDAMGAGVLAEEYQKAGKEEDTLFMRQVEYRCYSQQIEQAESPEERLSGWEGLCRVALAMKQPDQIHSQLVRAIEEFPQHAQFRIWLVQHLKEQHREAESLEHLKWLLARYPDDVQYQNMLESAVRQGHELAQEPFLSRPQ